MQTNSPSADVEPDLQRARLESGAINAMDQLDIEPALSQFFGT